MPPGARDSLRSPRGCEEWLHDVRPEPGPGPDRARPRPPSGAGRDDDPRAPLHRLLPDVPPGPDSQSEELADAPITIENLGWIRRHYYSNRSNLQLTDLDTAIEEVGKFRAVGGGAIVDATSTGISRNPAGLVRISRETGVHVVMGSGYYVAAAHPDDMDERSVEDLAREIIGDIAEGAGDSGVQAGVIGEVGCTWPLHPNERKSLLAAAIAQQETGAAILIHPGRDQDAPLEILDLLSSGGAEIPRVIMGHLDRDRLRVRGARAHRRLRLLPRVGPVRQRGLVLPAGRCRHAQRRAAARLHQAHRGRRVLRADRDCPGHLHEAPADPLRGARLWPRLREHRAHHAGARASRKR